MGGDPPKQPAKVSPADVNKMRFSFLEGVASALAEDRLSAIKDHLIGPLGPLGGIPNALLSIVKALDPKFEEPTIEIGHYDRDFEADSWNPMEAALKRGSIADNLTGKAIVQLQAGDREQAQKTAGDAGYQYGRMVLNAIKLGELVTGAAGTSLALASIVTEGRTFIVYVFKEGSNWRYVGRASGKGTPLEVLWGRIRKGHTVAEVNPHLEPEIVDVQQSRAANKAAEAVFHDRAKVMAEEGNYTLLNDPKVPPMSNLPEKFAKGYAAIVEFLIPKISGDLSAPELSNSWGVSGRNYPASSQRA